MLKEDLKRRAISLVDIPENYQPILEEYFEGENGQGEAMFAWTNEKEEEGITVSLDYVGQLIRLSIEKKANSHEIEPLRVEERKEIAEQFLTSHYPTALKKLSFYQSKDLPHATRFFYVQMVMDLPLIHSGCFIDVDALGDIVKFKYDALKQIPEIPTTLISKEKLMEDTRNRLEFQLTITNLFTTIHDVAESGLRLVYQPTPSFMKYRADILEPTLTILTEEDEQKDYVELPPPLSTNDNGNLSMEEIIGVTAEMEVIREVDMGEEFGIVWRNRDWEMKEEDLSLEGFFKKQSEDTVKAIISKKTGNLESFIWFTRRNGNQWLSRKSCYQKAIDLLHKTIPNYVQYLQLILNKNDDTEKESFEFQMHNGHGIPIDLGIVSVVVNRKTGQIDHYRGLGFDRDQLSQIPTEPAISKKEAGEIFFNHLDFQLEWNKDYEIDPVSYQLIYKACDRDSKKSIRFIDAVTGELILEKDE